ncbi:MAG: T9SS type A sorting domain-containing protein [Bacteroidota bacterium]|jgi:Secretion system C-terminal sorting domain
MNKYFRTVFFLATMTIFTSVKLIAQNDTLKVMAYNVLNYGDACQGSNKVMRNYLKNIISYTQPDILGLVKMSTIKRFPSDFNGNLPIDFCDSIVQYVLNPSGNISYNYCQYTNEARGGDMNVLFYNKNKLANIYTRVLTVNVTDFDLYKFYYKDSNLANSHDTTFLYVVLFHTQSGSDATVRNAQQIATFNALKTRFAFLPNMIMMGDFNLRSSSESGYNQMVTSTDTTFRFCDPPFAIDKVFTYPASWQGSATYAAYQTTSTRMDLIHPNSCGTDGGAKDWYDHILFSPWMVNGVNYMSYVPHSYKTIGNDGKRMSISINDSTTYGKNLSAPADVINSIFQLSNKYPIVSSIIVKSNTTGNSPNDPQESITGIAELSFDANAISISNPSGNILSVRINEKLLDKKMEISIRDISGKEFLKLEMHTESLLSHTIDISNLPKGFYFISFKIQDENLSITKKLIKAE